MQNGINFTSLVAFGEYGNVITPLNNPCILVSQDSPIISPAPFPYLLLHQHGSSARRATKCCSAQLVLCVLSSNCCQDMLATSNSCQRKSLPTNTTLTHKTKPNSSTKEALNKQICVQLFHQYPTKEHIQLRYTGHTFLILSLVVNRPVIANHKMKVILEILCPNQTNLSHRTIGRAEGIHGRQKNNRMYQQFHALAFHTLYFLPCQCSLEMKVSFATKK